MRRIDFHQHPYFPFLLVWRGILATFALYAVSDKPFGSMLVALGVIAIFLAIGETAYKSKVYFDNDRLRKEQDRLLREHRAAEARLRYEAFKAAQEETRIKYMALGLEDEPVEDATPAAGLGGAGGMTAEDFDFALIEGDALGASRRRMSARS